MTVPLKKERMQEVRSASAHLEARNKPKEITLNNEAEEEIARPTYLKEPKTNFWNPTVFRARRYDSKSVVKAMVKENRQQYIPVLSWVKEQKEIIKTEVSMTSLPAPKSPLLRRNKLGH